METKNQDGNKRAQSRRKRSIEFSLKKKQTRENPAASHEKMKGETTSRPITTDAAPAPVSVVQKRKILGVCQEIKKNKKKQTKKKAKEKNGMTN